MNTNCQRRGWKWSSEEVRDSYNCHCNGHRRSDVMSCVTVTGGLQWSHGLLLANFAHSQQTICCQQTQRHLNWHKNMFTDTRTSCWHWHMYGEDEDMSDNHPVLFVSLLSCHTLHSAALVLWSTLSALPCRIPKSPHWRWLSLMTFSIYIGGKQFRVHSKPYSEFWLWILFRDSYKVGMVYF